MRRVAITAIYFLACAAAVCPASGAAPAFFSRRDYTVPGDTWVAVADTNGDKIPDLITGGLTVWLGNGKGTFSQGPVSPTGMVVAYLPATADLNGDGSVDAVFTGQAAPDGPFGIGVCLGNGDGTFQKAVFYPAGPGTDTNMTSVVVGDFNNDGIPDAATIGTSGVWLFTGKGGGAFNPAVLVQYAGSGGDASITLAIGNFNADGNLDLVVPTTTGFAILLGNGNGTFGQESFVFPLPPPTAVGSIAVGDLNLDGNQDIVLIPDIRGHANSNFAFVYLGNGARGFSGPTLVDMPGGWPIAIGDINGDGIPDLVSSAGDIALGKGNGTFKVPYVEPIAFSGSYDVVLIDLRNNGLTDIVTQGGVGVVSVLLSEGKGRFEDGEWSSVPGAFGCGAPADYNGDGNPDLAVGTPEGITMLLGTGRASAPFTAGPALSLSFQSCPFEGDFNGDGIPDLLVVNQLQSGTGSVLIYLGNGDGTFTYKSSTAISTAIGGLVLGDFNHDGNLDVALSGNWMLLGNGNGTFQTPAHFSSNPTSWTAITAGDINGDGWPDLVLYDWGYSNTIYVLLNNQHGGFTQTTMQDTSNNGPPFYILLANLRPNGNVDMIVSQDGLAGATVYAGDGKGSFTLKDNFTFPTDEPSLIAVGDVNGDGIPDLLLLNTESLGVYLGEGNGEFEPPFLLGPGDDPGQIFLQNLHGQAASAGLPDIVLPDGTGGVMVLTNLTK
jgi:hypothetical protein